MRILLLGLMVLASICQSDAQVLIADGFDYPVSHRGYDASGLPIPLDQHISSECNHCYADAVSTGCYDVTNTTSWYNANEVGRYYSTLSGLHPGEDWNYMSGNADVGEPVYAIANGQVVQIRETYAGQNYGWTLIIKHTSHDGRIYHSIYSHITNVANTDGTEVSDKSMFEIKEDDPVYRGQVIGRVANLTTLSPHLHFEIRDNRWTSTDLYPNDNGNGYYSSVGDMKTDGVIDPSDFINAHRPGIINEGIEIYAGSVAAPEDFAFDFVFPHDEFVADEQSIIVYEDGVSQSLEYIDLVPMGGYKYRMHARLSAYNTPLRDCKKYSIAFDLVSNTSQKRFTIYGKDQLYFLDSDCVRYATILGVDATAHKDKLYADVGYRSGFFRGIPYTIGNRAYEVGFLNLDANVTKGDATKMLYRMAEKEGLITEIDDDVAGGTFTNTTICDGNFRYAQTLYNETSLFSTDITMSTTDYMTYGEMAYWIYSTFDIVENCNTAGFDCTINDDVACDIPEWAVALYHLKNTYFTTSNGVLYHIANIEDASCYDVLSRGDAIRLLVGTLAYLQSQNNTNALLEDDKRDTDFKSNTGLLTGHSVLGYQKRYTHTGTSAPSRPAQYNLTIPDDTTWVSGLAASTDDFGRALSYYHHVDGGQLLSLQSSHNQIQFIPPDVSESETYNMYTWVGDQDGNYADAEVLIHVVDATTYVDDPVSSMEYYIDTDPGEGQGTSITVPSSSSLELDVHIPLSGISPGIHTLYVRAQNSEGKWSFTQSKVFIIFDDIGANNDRMAELEYYIDQDPGEGQGNPLGLSSDTDSDAGYTIDLSPLTAGIHTLYVRAKNNRGLWSFVQSKVFIVFDDIGANNDRMAELEYYIDQDPGEGQAHPLGLSNDSLSDAGYTIDLSSLTAGIHTLHVRAKNNRGLWSFVQSKVFIVFDDIGANNDRMAELEYYIDQDPGEGQAHPLGLSNDSLSDAGYTIDLSSLTAGIHTLHVRAKNNRGLWSFVQSKIFVVYDIDPMGTNRIVQLEYFIDEDPGEGLAQQVAITPGQDITAEIEVDVAGLTGNHYLFTRARDAYGQWSMVAYDTISWSGNEIAVSYPGATQTYVAGQGQISHISWDTTGSVGAVSVQLIGPDGALVHTFADLYSASLQYTTGWSIPGGLVKGYYRTLVYDSKNPSVKGYSAPFYIDNSCTDQIQNGYETGIDCGGGCDPCEGAILIPIVQLSKTIVNQGDLLQITGSNYTPMSLISISIVSGNYDSLMTIYSDALGHISIDFLDHNALIPASYYVYAFDESKESVSNEAKFIVRKEISSFELRITSDLTSHKLIPGESFQLHWQDKMLLGNRYPVMHESALRKFKYEISVRKNGGSTYQFLEIHEGYAAINSIQDFSVPIELTEAGDNVVYRVRDMFQTDRYDLSDPVIVEAVVAYPITLIKVWDESFPNTTEQQNTKIMGICADGVSRFMYKLADATPDNPITQITARLEIAGRSTTDTKVLGRIKAATHPSGYSDEANEGGASTLILDNSTSEEAYYFWYVAPDDFNDGTSEWDRLAKRKVLLYIDITRLDGTNEGLQDQIDIVRPPILLVHGLNQSSDVWDEMAYHDESLTGQKFLESNLFYAVHAVSLSKNAHFEDNAKSLLSYGSGIANSYYQPMLMMRKQGYVSTQVDCITYSMGGNIVRKSTMDVLNDIFYENRPHLKYKNYGKGNIHKLITMDTPHAGSPWADFLGDLVDGELSLEDGCNYAGNVPLCKGLYNSVEYIGKQVFSVWIVDNPSSFPATFFYNDGSAAGYDAKISLTGAVEDLKTIGGERFDRYNGKAHTIAGDIVKGKNLPAINNDVYQYLKNLGSFYSSIEKMVSFIETNFDFTDPILKQEFTEAKGVANSFGRAIKIVNVFMKIYEVADFFIDSDFIVSVNSQTSTLPYVHDQVSVINGINHVGGSTAQNNLHVGDRVLELLNTSIWKPAFGDLPSTIPTQQLHNRNVAKSLTSQIEIRHSVYVSDQFEIIYPDTLTHFDVNEIINLQVAIADTINLEYVKIFFQNEVFRVDNPSPEVVFNLTISDCCINTQGIEIYGYYEYGDSTGYAYDFQTISVRPSSSLIDFNASPEVNNLYIGDGVRPQYQVIYEDFISTLDLGTEQVSVAIMDTSIIRYNPLLSKFESLKKGSTYADVSYEGHIERLYFMVDTGSDLIICQDQLIVDDTVFLVDAELDAKDLISVNNSQIKGANQLTMTANGIELGLLFEVNKGGELLIKAVDGCGE